MKKFICSFMAIFILMLFFNVNFVQAVDPIKVDPGENGIAQFDGSRIVAYKDLNAIRVKLANGNVIAEFSSSANIEQTENIEKTTTSSADICFVLDVSSSMSNNYVDKAKTISRLKALLSATSKFIDELTSKFAEPENLRIGLILFGSKAIKVYDLLSCDDTHISNLKNILVSEDNILNAYNKKAARGTNSGAGIVEAEKCFENSTQNNKFMIIVTDGDDNDITGSKKKASSIPKDIKTIILLIGMSSSNTYGSPESPNYGPVYTSVNSSIEDVLLNAIFDEVITSFAYITSLRKIVHSYGIIEGNNYYIATIDNELLYGATLEMEYSITLKSSKEIGSIYVLDDLSSGGNNTFVFTYDPNAKLITEDNTNSYYNWSNYSDPNFPNYIFCNPNQTEVGKDITVKLLLSTTLSSEKDIDYLANTATVQFTDPTSSLLYYSTVTSPGFSILPPFGKSDVDLRPYYVLITAHVGFIIVLIILKKKK